MGDGIVQRALSSLGKGFDLSSDFRLKYCKGDGRLVLLNESDTWELRVPGFGSLADVSNDIKCDKGDRTRYQTDILDFKKMSEIFNQKSSMGGKVPSGLFNSMFGFQSGSWAVDASNTKNLGLDGYYIVLFTLRIDRHPLILADHVRNEVPTKWDPAALARFIEKYGTHIIVGLSIGGKDVVLVKQDKCSNMDSSHLKNHLDNLGDQLFTGACPFSPNHPNQLLQNNKEPQAFREIFDPQPNLFSNYASATSKDGISVICSRRGGDPRVSTHCEWLPTVGSKPDAIHFNFIPITSLLRGVPGRGFLSHAINLYLHKPPIGDLQYFLDFQAHKIWAPIHSDLPLGPKLNKALQTPSLSFNLMGPKLYVNTTQVTAGNTPVTGIRLYLEGIKSNRLGIHLQQLVNPPVLLEDKLHHQGTWRGTEDTPDHHRYLEPIHWKKFSHVCTAPVKYDPRWLNPGAEAAFIITGAQLHVNKDVLHLRLLYTRVSATCIIQSNWMQTASANHSFKSGFFSSISTSITGTTDKDKSEPVIMDSAVYPTGPPALTQKMLKFVDTTELCRGPSDSPGHWLVTGAKLDVEKRKICLRVKFSLLNLSSQANTIY
ncbi:MACPF domain-containing protein At1g14780-like isoform X2 [Salvia splendens]|uniref:MACPF domain-containing protein At1g14780-like isoform X2 n=1 Tax=Salvia splendens TaxID=180675 RepID=UPI001C27E322|nr:MACPF domain-containing protein At1g14780-like isoform X2 [Salvia splendens]